MRITIRHHKRFHIIIQEINKVGDMLKNKSIDYIFGMITGAS